MSALPSLTTPRLTLRPFTAADAPVVERLAGSRAVADTTLNIPHPYPAGGGASWIATHAEQWERGTNVVLAIVANAAIVGAVNLAVERAHARGELGYWIAEEAWGRGYATEAARAMAAFGFSEMALHRIQGRHFTRNPASGRVMEKIGMRREGVHRDMYERWGVFEDVAMWGMLAGELIP